MKRFHILAASAAAVGIAGLAVPAAAQTYPYPQPYQQPYPQGYPQQYPQGYPQTGYAYPGQPGYGAQNPVGAIINQLLGNRYNVTDRSAVSQCASAAMTQAAAQYPPRYTGYNGYNQGYGQGYGQQYGYNPASMMRVTAITNVERRNNGLRVSGMLSNAGGYAYGQQGYGQQGYSDPRYANRGNLSFRCNVDYRGAVTNIRIRRA